jgi:hypothetical protein
MKDWRLDSWIREHLPEEKEKYSRDAVEILLGLLWEEAMKTGQQRERDEHLGDYDV